MHLVKLKHKRSSEPGYLKVDLVQLRAFADAIDLGNRRCLRLFIYLRQRGRPMRKWPPLLQSHGREQLPEKLTTPKFVELADFPLD
jgi:hypothetical protein